MDKKYLATEIKLHLNAYLGDLISDVVLFGSQTQGTATADSDFDVLIVLKTDDLLRTDLMAIMLHLSFLARRM